MKSIHTLTMAAGLVVAGLAVGSALGAPDDAKEKKKGEPAEQAEGEKPAAETAEEADAKAKAAPEFTLKDTNDKEHTLSRSTRSRSTATSGWSSSGSTTGAPS